jgi:hypothetical protein
LGSKVGQLGSYAQTKYQTEFKYLGKWYLDPKERALVPGAPKTFFFCCVFHDIPVSFHDITQGPKTWRKNFQVSSSSKPVKQMFFWCLQLHSATTGRKFALSHLHSSHPLFHVIPCLFRAYYIWNNIKLHGGIKSEKSGMNAEWSLGPETCLKSCGACFGIQKLNI